MSGYLPARQFRTLGKCSHCGGWFYLTATRLRPHWRRSENEGLHIEHCPGSGELPALESPGKRGPGMGLRAWKRGGGEAPHGVSRPT